MYWPPPRATRPDTPLPYTSPFRSRRDRRPARRRMTGGHAGEDRATSVPSTGETWPPGMKIVNAHLARSIREQGMLQEPNGFGYIHLAGEVRSEAHTSDLQSLMRISYAVFCLTQQSYRHKEAD